VKASYIGSKIFEAEHLFKSFGDLKILDDFSYIFSRYEKMGIVGNNGTGKSTFIKMLMGEVQPIVAPLILVKRYDLVIILKMACSFDDQLKVIDVVQNIAEVIELGMARSLQPVSSFNISYLLPKPSTAMCIS
jgi:ATP-binding cassette subfamily F protein uup